MKSIFLDNSLIKMQITIKCLTWKRLQNNNMYDYQQTNKQQITLSVFQKLQTSGFIYHHPSTNICEFIPQQKIEKWRKTINKKSMKKHKGLDEQNYQFKYEPLIYLKLDLNNFKIYNYCEQQQYPDCKRNDRNKQHIRNSQENNQQSYSGDLFIVCPSISQQQNKQRILERYKTNVNQARNTCDSKLEKTQAQKQTTSAITIKNLNQKSIIYTNISFPIDKYFQIDQGDIVKIGKLLLKIQKIVRTKNKIGMYYEDNAVAINDRNAFSQITNKIQLSDQNAADVSDQNAADVSDQQLAESCRYCLSKTVTKKNPLINICKCQGSSKFTHARCLSKWVKQRSNLHMNEQKSVAFASMKGFVCEICKNELLSHKLIPYFLEEQSENFKEYAIIRIMSKPNQTIYFLNLSHNDKSYFSVGRQNQNDIIVSDLSASRKHFMIQLDKRSKKMYVYDLKSKFGTLVRTTKQRNNLLAAINNRNDLRFQKGRTIFQIEKKKKIGLLHSIFCSQTQNLISQAKKR